MGWVVAGLTFVLIIMLVENWRLYGEIKRTQSEARRFTEDITTRFDRAYREAVEVVEPEPSPAVDAARPYVYALRLAGVEMTPQIEKLILKAVEEGWSTTVLFRKAKEVRDG